MICINPMTIDIEAKDEKEAEKYATNSAYDLFEHLVDPRHYEDGFELEPFVISIKEDSK